MTRRIVLLAVTLLLSAGSSAQSIEFKHIMGQATTRVNKTVPIELEGGKLKGIASNDQIAIDGANMAWRLMLTGWSEERGTANDVIISHSPTIIAHYGNRFEYLSLTPEIPGPVYDAVVAETEREQRDLVREYGDIEVSFTRTGNQLTVNGIYEYRHGSGGERIENRLVHLMNGTRTLIRKIMDETQKKERDLRKEIENGRPTFVSADDMSMYFNWNVDEYRKEQTKTEHGGWRYWWHDIEMRVWNYGDHYELGAMIPTTSFATPEGIQSINDAALEWARDHMPRGAVSVRTEQDYYDPTDQALLFRFDFSGDTKGEDHQKYIDKFQDDYLKDAWKKMDEITSELWENPNDVPIPYLSYDVFEYLANDGLEDLRSEHAQAAEGWYEFNYLDQDYELYNFGDSLWYSIYVQLPEADDSRRNALTGSIKEWVRTHPADGASRMDVLRYPGYEHLVWIRAAYAIDGSYTGAELARRYHAFVEEWASAAGDQATTIMEGS